MPQLALLLTTIIWGATFPATKAVLEQIPPLSFLFLRFVLGAVFAFVLLRALGFVLRADAGTLRRSLVATVWLFLGYALQTVGLDYTSASNSAFITVLYVVFVPLILRRFERRTWAGAALATAGLWFLVNPAVTLNVGDLLTLGCAIAFAGHIACLEGYTRQGDAVSFFVWQLAFVAVLMLPAMWLESPPPGAFAPTSVLVLGLTVTGILATGAFAVQIWAQQVLPAQRVALIFSLEPACAAWLAWYFLGEQMEMRGWIGSALILAAVILGALSPKLHEPAGREASLSAV
ncbi:DMT family transporter [Candidatus Nitrospira bockiana]